MESETQGLNLRKKEEAPNQRLALYIHKDFLHKKSKYKAQG